MKFLYSLFSSLWLVLCARASTSQGKDVNLDDIIHGMTFLQKTNAMAQIHIALILKDDDESQIDLNKVDYFFGQLGIGSLLIVPVGANYFSAEQYRDIVLAVQNVTDHYGLPPVLATMDSIHGANYIKNATLFPQALNLAATFEPKYAHQAGYYAARDSAAAGIPWIYSPTLGLGVNPYWSRIVETYGEDPLLVSDMATAAVQGIQIEGDDFRAAATAKHFIGYSASQDGHDRSPAWIPERHLFQYFMRPWQKVLRESKPMAVMEGYNEYDGVPMIVSKRNLKDLLRVRLGFDGVLVSDYEEVNHGLQFHKVVKSLDEAIELLLTETSVDVNMIPMDTKGWMHGVEYAGKNKTSRVTPTQVEQRLNDSVRRIFKLKQNLGLFDGPMTQGRPLIDKVGDDDSREASKLITYESIILAKNNNSALPIPKTTTRLKVHITGPTRDSMQSQSGGWTIQWQGGGAQFGYGSGMLKSVMNRKDEWDVMDSCGVDFVGKPCDGKNSDFMRKQQAKADYIFVCLGEHSYTEKPGDVTDLQLRQGQIDFVSELREVNPSAKIVVIFFGGRPRLLGTIPQVADAIILGFLAGPDAADAVVDLMAGDANFVGRLPISYPKHGDLGGVPYWKAVTDQCTTVDPSLPLPFFGFIPCEVEWPFGHGLSYSNFDYDAIKSDKKSLVYGLPWTSPKKEDGITYSVKVTNTGDMAGIETVMFFLFVENRHVTPEMKQLVHYERIHLEPGESAVSKFVLTEKNLQHIGPYDESHDVVQIGSSFRVGVGAHTMCRVSLSEVDEKRVLSPLCSDSATLELSAKVAEYNPSCLQACQLLDSAHCLHQYPTAGHCYEACRTDPLSYDAGEDFGWGWDYVNCIEPILLDQNRNCQDIDLLCRNVFDATTVIPQVSDKSSSNKWAMIWYVICGIVIGVLGTRYISKSMKQKHVEQSQLTSNDFLYGATIDDTNGV
mmetsp:Transcript_26394/g.39994  ORF Transcript_26394/g.39994 Transcript_26394/m.39994 type:complete len:951 (-) Transcript_26394:77-2929(-)|eukprot:CAMPEP_0178933886 /NCGR_PEP_ID=MMETSP0786-20121207/23550_1 /TAXON_ID=186022 /ORGANISM="Thalassionema frauenfeldii, Strain CCMP 1798" /LENGTH=950 /DNA_ID=CAMNT_0020611595 /DNA_START=80 /DNA_END=2932 /DNA_ORIENTATION=+